MSPLRSPEPCAPPGDAGALVALAEQLRARPDGRPDAAWLGRLAARLEVPRCTWARVAGEPPMARLHEEYRAGPLVPVPEERLRPGALQRLRRGETLILDRMAELAGDDLPPLHATGAASALVVPLLEQGTLAGLVTLQTFSPREWTREEVAFALQAIGLIGAGPRPAPVARREQEADALLYRRLLDNLPSAVAFVVDADLRYQLAAGGALRAAGLQPSDVVGKTVREVFGPVLAEAIEIDYRRALQGEDFINEHEYLGRHYITHGTALRLADGRIGGALAVAHEVTDRVLAERRLRASEQRYRLMFEGSPHPMWIFDEQTLKFLAVNAATCRLYGWSEQEFLRMGLEDVRPPREVPQLREQVQGEMAAAPRRGGIWRHRKKNGELLDVEIASHALALDDRKMRLVLVHDITERLRAERLLRESEATLRSFHDSAAQLMGVVEVAEDDGDFLLVHVNPATEAHYGTSAGTLAGCWSRELDLPPPVRELWIRHYRASQREGRPVRFEARQPSPRGELWLAASVAFIGIGTSGRARFSYVADEVTERKQAEQKLAEGEQRLALALRAGQLGFFDMDARSGHVHYGGHWAAMLGRRLDDIRPTLDSWNELVHPEDLQRVLGDSQAHLIGQTGAFRFEYRMRHADGGWRWVLACGEVVERDARGRAVRMLGTHTDITDRKRSEEALRQADQRKDEFLAVLAHELRNPLAPVRTAVEILRRSDLREPRAGNAREVIERQINHMVRLIDDLLDVARITHGKVELQPGLVSLQSVVQMAVEVAQPNLSAARQALHQHLPREPLWLDADRLRLSQVVLNLLNNASKYTPAGGRIALRASRVPEGVLLEVSDTGIGIDAEALERLFHMFSQVHDKSAIAAGGLGVGLALSKAIVQLHGGRISASSPGLGQGSTFAVVLPGAAQPPAAGDEPAAGGDAAADNRLRVLVADDSADAAETLAVLLELMGHETRTANCGQQAIDETIAWQPDLVLLDLGLPDMDGCEACRAIRAAPLPRQPVVVALTGWGQDEDRRRTERAGFDGHLVKPVDEAELAPFFALAAARRAGGAAS